MFIINMLHFTTKELVLFSEKAEKSGKKSRFRPDFR